MEKIMFNDKYGLTQAVLEGRKTMTRRIIHDDVVKIYSDPWDLIGNCARYHFDEIVAVAQRYCDVLHCADVPKGDEKGWGNKMFVKADLMPHQIKITDIRVERLQDISDEDCLREGIMKGEFMNTWDTFYYDEWGDVPNHITFKTAREAFAALIDKVSGKGTWESNPYCFCYTFELID